MTRAVTRWRRVVGGAAVLAVLTAPSIASAAGRTYEVVQCDSLNRGVAGAALDDDPAYGVKQGCADPQGDHAIKIFNTRFAHHRRSGRVRWSTQSPSLRIVGASVDARLRRDRGHVPRLWMADDAGNEVARVAIGTKHSPRFRHYRWHSTGQRATQFIAHLRCERRRGCDHSEIAKTWLRNVHFEVADSADPRLTQVGGSLSSPGWVRGGASVSVHGVDSGSGIRRISLEVNDAALASSAGLCDRVQGTTVTPVFAPCEPGLGLDAPVRTSRSPFHDGQNLVSLCLFDFAGNRTCRENSVHIDNTPPTLSFTRFQNPNDPELVRAPIVDATSGVSTGRIYYRAVGDAAWRPLPTQDRFGQLRTRVNSTLDPPGRYEFMARAIDRAGNATVTTRRANGQPMVLTFPLKAGVQLQGHLRGGSHRQTVGYGRTSKVAGVLRDASGNALADQEVTVTEYFGEGALIDTRVRTVQTDANGRWQERLPGGPSRKVSATYAGTRRYLPDATTAGALRVKTKASLRISKHRVREGHRVAFKGRIGHLAARIPARGKLIELEVKDGKSWHTVRRPFYTSPNGRYRLRYRFARFYVSNVRYRFRVRVIREQNWPYKAPVSSRVRKLVVKAR